MNDGTTAGYKLAWKKDAIPTLAELKAGTTINTPETSAYTVEGLDDNAQYGFWAATLDEDGNLQTAQMGGNPKLWNTITFMDTNVVEVGYPPAWTSNTFYFYQSKSGDVFCGNDASTNTGIYHLNKTTLEWEQVYTTGYNWQYWFESSTGDIFVSSTSSKTGILKWNGTTFEKVYTPDYKWQYWFESSTGDIFVSSTSSTGILKWNGTTFEKVYTTDIIGNIGLRVVLVIFLCLVVLILAY